MPVALASIKDVMAFFEMPAGLFAKEWKRLSETEKTQIKAGLADGTLTY